MKSWGRTEGLQTDCGNEWQRDVITCWVLPAGSHGWGCLVGEGCGSVLLPKQLSRRKQFLFLFFSFCFALREERKLWCVKFGLSSVIKSELFKGGNYNYRMFLTPWTKMNDAVHSSVLCKCFGDYLTLHTHCLFKTSSILEYANFKIIVTLLVAKWIFLLSVKSSLSTGLMLSDTLLYKEDT